MFFCLEFLVKKIEFVLIASITILLNCFMIVESSMTLELFHDSGKTFLIAEKIIGVIIFRTMKTCGFFTLLLLSCLYLFYQYSPDSLA